ncbi:MAG: YajQ family cyclic di-GMP-binding protein [Candidatus Tectomicrobia bacterium]|nr:YajQ family cyclic di-GMP-binding protein [Candidatus Tectomicrobia bacterium]
MPSFDIVSRTDLQEVENAVQGIRREIGQRFDFKGSKCAIERKDQELILLADDDFKLKQMHDLMATYLARRKVDARALEYGKPEEASGGALRQTVKIRNGIDQETAKSISKAIRDSKLKVQAAIQGDELRVSGKKKDDLQAVIALCREMKVDLPLQYVNFRD